MSEQTKVDMSMIGRLKTPPDGRCFHTLAPDGVVRVWHFDTWSVIDAVGLSLAQIKEWLERRPFSQEKEDMFRGVDGRDVSRERMLNPERENVPERPSQEFIDEHFKAFEERVREGRERDDGVDKGGGSCGVKRSTYNLNPI